MKITVKKLKNIIDDIISDKEWVNDSESAAEYKGVVAGLEQLLKHIKELNQETKEGHCPLIAEFMGVVFHDDENQYYDDNGLYIGKDLHYRKSWDWLMPVIAKITRDIRWRGNKYREYLMDIVPLDNIEYAYSAVVDFIEEYNKYQNKDDNN